MFWKENILNMLSSTVLNTVDSCQFQLDGDQWKYAEITDTSEIDGKYVITITIPEAADGTVTGIQLLGMGSVIGQREEHIVKKSGQIRIMKLKFRVYEEGES